MQTTRLNSTSGSERTSSPSAAQVFQGQIQDYELLLSFLRNEVGSLTHLLQTLINPSRYSPLDQVNELGQVPLQQLLADPDYRELCKNNNVSPHYLTVTLKDRLYVYETSNRGGEDKTELNLTGNAKWQELRTRLEKSVALLGGQIRYDRLISLPRLAMFYAIAPWDPTVPTQHQATIDTVEEKLASYRLQLEDDFNILQLRRSPTKSDRDKIKAAREASTHQARIDRQELHTRIIAEYIIQSINEFLAPSTSPLTYLAKNILASATTEQVRATPTVYLQTILQSPEAETMTTSLMQSMRWFGGKNGEETSPFIRTKVIASALQIWFRQPQSEPTGGIAGYDLLARANWGKSYQAIRSEFEAHLLASRRATSEKEAIVLARLFLCQFPAGFVSATFLQNFPTRAPSLG